MLTESSRIVSKLSILAAVIFLLMVFVVLPLLPDNAIDPWNIFLPKRFVAILIVIGGIQFASHLLVRLLGERIGLPLSGLLGGFISSTATFLTLPTFVQKDQKAVHGAISAALLACASTFLCLLILILTASPKLVLAVLLPVGVAMLIALVVGFFSARQNFHLALPSSLKDPWSIWPTVRLAILFLFVLGLMSVIQRQVGVAGTQLTSFIAGLAELHSTSMSAAILFLDGKLSMTVARSSILLAALASLVSKLAIVWFRSRDRYAVIVSVTILAMITSLVLFGWVFV